MHVANKIMNKQIREKRRLGYERYKKKSAKCTLRTNKRSKLNAQIKSWSSRIAKNADWASSTWAKTKNKTVHRTWFKLQKNFLFFFSRWKDKKKSLCRRICLSSNKPDRQSAQQSNTHGKHENNTHKITQKE